LTVRLERPWLNLLSVTEGSNKNEDGDVVEGEEHPRASSIKTTNLNFNKSE
jgi:hypothetical protein